jgi:diguanylate cyclase (GGDEF)-like protein
MPDARAALHVLLDLTRRLTDEIGLEESLAEVCRASLALLPADHTSVRLLDDSGTTLLCGARAGTGATTTPVSFRPGQGLAGWVVRHEQPACIGDTSADERFEPHPGQGFVTTSIVAVPLWSAGHVIGVLSVSSPKRDAFDEEHLLLARLLANCAVPAFEKARLERIATTDSHTKAYNRRWLVPRLSEEMARSSRTGSPLSLLLMDLDHFKRVNDEHGHAEGDVVLRSFADRVRAVTRRQDALVRWGGEEFILVMPDTDRDRALDAGERIRSHVADRPFTLSDGTHITQTVSIGVATWDGHESPNELENRADRAMYAAKHQGRDRVALAS